MIGSLIALVLTAGTVISNCSINTQINNNENSITYNCKTEKLTSLNWHNNNIVDDETNLLFEKYSINYNEAISSEDVYIQEEYVYMDDIEEDYLMTSKIQTNENFNDDYTHNEGYIRFITKAYAFGVYDGNIVYHVEVTTEQKKSFIINKKDNLVIRHGNNAVSLNDSKFQCKGLRHTPCTIYWTYNSNPTNADENEVLIPQYPDSRSGVYYTFSTGHSSTSGEVATVLYGNTTVTADYYLVATDTTEVQPIYVHNHRIFAESISLQYGPVGVSFPTDSGISIMEGRSLTLKGYKNRLAFNKINLNPSNYGFEPQYYFYPKNKDIITNSTRISSSRLRCGYIENQYINLSPNRKNAGEAYLELYFDSYVYEIKTKLSFWGPVENLSSSMGDKAVVQYLDSNGNWIDCYDILANNISKDRNNPDTITINTITWTKGIRFYAKKNNPSTTWNKGRICIGESTFYTVSVEY